MVALAAGEWMDKLHLYTVTTAGTPKTSQLTSSILRRAQSLKFTSDGKVVAYVASEANIACCDLRLQSVAGGPHRILEKPPGLRFPLVSWK